MLAGGVRLAAAKIRGLKKVPALIASGLSAAEKRAYVLADNKLAEKAGWDRDLLALELGELAELLAAENLDLALTGFDAAEMDAVRALSLSLGSAPKTRCHHSGRPLLAQAMCGS